MDINFGFLSSSLVKIGAILAWVYGLLWCLGTQPGRKAVGILVAFGDHPAGPLGADRRRHDPERLRQRVCCSRPAPWPWSRWA